jgi:hypothetical protein
VVPATIVPFSDNTGAWLFFTNPLPGASTITLHVQGDKIKGTDGTFLDAAGTGTAGSDLTETFTTVSTAPVPGTTITGIVVDPGPDAVPMTPDDVKAAPDGLADYANDTWKLPIARVKVYVLGHEQDAVYTDSTGHFTLTNVPVGDVKVEFDGTTATNAPAGFYFPVMVMDTTIRPGVANTMMGSMGTLDQQAANAADPAVYLPRLTSDILTPVSTTAPTVVTAPADAGTGGTNLTPQQLSDLSLTVAPGSLVDANGNPVSNAQVGISPVPAQLVMDMLPAGLLQHTFDITIQAPGGATFTTPAQLTMPNVFGLSPGDKTFILSFDHTTGKLVIDGTGTVSADGLTVTTDPGSGVTAPGWHGMAPAGTTVSGSSQSWLDKLIDFGPLIGDTSNLLLGIGLTALLAAGLAALTPEALIIGAVAVGVAAAKTFLDTTQNWNDIKSGNALVKLDTTQGAIGSLASIFAPPAALSTNSRLASLGKLFDSGPIGVGLNIIGEFSSGFHVGNDLIDLYNKGDLPFLAPIVDRLSPAVNTAASYLVPLSDSVQGLSSAFSNLVSPTISSLLPSDRTVKLYLLNGMVHATEANGADYINPTTGTPLSIPLSNIIDANFFQSDQNRTNLIQFTNAVQQWSDAASTLAITWGRFNHR